MTFFWLNIEVRAKNNIGGFDLVFKRRIHRLVIVLLSVNGEKNGPTQFESGPFF